MVCPRKVHESLNCGGGSGIQDVNRWWIGWWQRTHEEREEEGEDKEEIQ